jgi:hypothetical protein
MLYRKQDGSYTASSPDGEHSVQLTKEEGENIIQETVPEPWQSQILSETQPGFVLT